MYAWRCWREFRFRFFGYLTLLVVIGLTGPLVWAVKKDARGEWTIVRPKTPDQAVNLWKDSWAPLLGLGTLVTALAAFGIGNSGVGSDLDQKTAEFLLTRPRRRRYFLWTGWTTGAAAILTLVMAGFAGATVPAWLLGGRPDSPRMFFLFPAILTIGMVFYGLTHLMTVLLGSMSKGTIYSMGIVVVYMGLGLLLYSKWNILLPHFGPLISWSIGRIEAFPIANLAGWWAMTVALGFAAQFVFDRAEV